MTQANIDIGTGPSIGDGDPIRTAFNKVNENFTELYATINQQGITYVNVAGISSSTGTGATFNITKYANDYAAVVNQQGTGYGVGNVITVWGNVIGGTYATNDLLITVANIGNAAIGNIRAIGSSGSPSVPILSVAGRTGAVVLTVNDIIGLSNAYAISSSTATANTAMRGYVDAKITANIAALINGAPGALDTLQELAAALGNNASFAATITNSLATTNSNLIVANTNMRGYVDGQIIAANSGIASAVTLANTGLKGYVDFTNSVLSTEIATANIGLKGYVDQANSIQSAQVGAANLAITAANVGLKGYVDQANTIQSAQVNAANLAITAANVGLKGYVDFTNSVLSTEIAAANVGLKGYVDQANSIQSAQIAAANIGLKGYIDQANTIQSAQIAAANIGIIGYIDLANTIQSGQIGAANLAIIAANLGMKGYVDSVATLSIYSNVNTKAYTESMGFQNFSNVNVAAYVTTSNSAIIGYVDLANTIQSAQVGAANLAITAANVGMKGYVDSQSFYSNTKVATYLQAGNISNVSVAGNVTATYFIGNGALLTGISGGISSYSNVQVATYLPTYSGNIANIRLGSSGVLTFADGTTQITAGGGGSNYGNANVTVLLVNYYGNIAANIVKEDHTWSFGINGNLTVPGSIKPQANLSYNLGNATNRWSTIWTDEITAQHVLTANLDVTGGVISTSKSTGALTITSGGGIGVSGNIWATNIYANSIVTYGNIVPSANVTYSLGNVTNRWKDLYLSGNTIFLGDTTITTSGGAVLTPVTRQLFAQSFLPGSTNSAATFTLNRLPTAGSTRTVLVIGVQGGGPAPSYTLTEGVDFTISGLSLIITASYTATNISCYENYSDTGDLITATEVATDTITPGSGDLTVIGNITVDGDLYVSPTSIYMGNLRISAADGNLTVNTGVKFSDGSVQSSAYSNVKVKAYTETMGYQNYGNVNVSALITTNGLTNYSNVNVIAYLAGNITVGNIAGSVNGYSIGYRDVPQITVANLTLIASDAGKHYYGANTNPTTITIPTNVDVAFGNGTAISIVNQGTGNITVANAAGVLLYLAGNSTAGSRTLTSYGMATLIKVQVNTWFINGTGVV